MRFRLIVTAAAFVFLLSSLTTGWALYTRFSQSNTRFAQAVAARKDNAKTWHAVICSIESATLRSKTLNAVQKDDALAFYDSLLVTNVHTAPCGLRTPAKR